MVRVYDDYVDVKDPQTGHLKCNLRVIIYLEDNGVVKGDEAKADNKGSNALQKAREQAKMNADQGAGMTNPNLSNLNGGQNPGGDY